MDTGSSNAIAFVQNSVFSNTPLRNTRNSTSLKGSLCNPDADKGLQVRPEREDKYLHEMKVASHPPEVNVSEVALNDNNNSAIKLRVDNIIKKACAEITTTVCYKTADQLLERLSIFQMGEEKYVEANSLCDMHRAFSIFRSDSQLFKCTLANQFPLEGSPKISAHHFLVVKIGHNWRLCQSMADRYTLSDFVAGRHDFISDFILLCNKIHDRCNAQIGDKTGFKSHDLKNTEEAEGTRATIDKILERTLCAQDDIGKMSDLNEWLGHAFFVKTVLPLLAGCLKNSEDDSFIKLFGADRKFLKTENRGALELRIKSVPILGE